MTKFSLALLAGVLSHLAFGQANGKLQIHFMDVGQGDGAVLISPQGQVVLFDGGQREGLPQAARLLGATGNQIH
jgi:beta-lactamase superfamily II metal-dependent hydrolase